MVYCSFFSIIASPALILLLWYFSHSLCFYDTSLNNVHNIKPVNIFWAQTMCWAWCYIVCYSLPHLILPVIKYHRYHY